MCELGVNIDHVATLRQARGVAYPDPIEAAKICESAGCNSIVCHLREDRRHIIDEDVHRLKKAVSTRLNLEMSIAKEIVDIACHVKPEQATLVPERRREVTTEGGLDVVKNLIDVKKAVGMLKDAGIEVSLFIDPIVEAVEASMSIGVKTVEFHTGEYANATSADERDRELKILQDCTRHALSYGMTVNAGHGLNYDNVLPVANVRGMHELNIGHSIVSYAVFYGLDEAVRKMKGIIG